jgi:gliding motility-associated lipoprotein GldH
MEKGEIKTGIIKMNLKIKHFLYFSALWLFTSCGETPLFEKVYTFNGHQWNQKVKPSFVVNIADTTVSYDFILTLRTTTDYGFSNLWIFLNSTAPHGEAAREPFEFKIADANGFWLGKNSGSVLENQIVFRNRRMPQKGKYTFVVEQGITQSNVDEVLDISLVVQKTKASE